MFLWKKNKFINYDKRADGVEPSMIILHYTGMKSAEEALARMKDPTSKVSAHYMIYEDGELEEIVPEDMRAWHAGVSFWQEETDINSHSIGIEIVNPGHEHGYVPFPQEQMDGVLELCRDVLSRYDIGYVLGHSDIAPERKTDPGEMFDWEWLAKNGVGMWPEPKSEDKKQAEDIAINDFEVEKLFIAYGYNPMAAFQDIVTAFHRHYHPEVFVNNTESQVSAETVARLMSLIRQST